MTVLLEAPGVALAMSPEHGAKITSLRDTFAHREWLEQPRAGLADFDPAVSFDEGDLCGWDEMMPTIDACRYPGTTIELAEHGDLWRTPWTLEEVSARSVTTSVFGTSLPFSLSRTVEVSAQRIDLHYSLQTRGAGALHLLYAAHPLFRYLPGTRIVLGAGPHCLVGLRDDETSAMLWPVGGLDLVDAVAPGTSRKLFLDPSARLSTVRLIDARGTSLAMSWRLDELAYLGVWLDHGHLSAHPVLSIEPTNGFGDSLQRCVDRSSIAPTPGHTTRTWSISIRLANRSFVGFESPQNE